MRYGTGYVPAGHNLSLGIRLYLFFSAFVSLFVQCHAARSILSVRVRGGGGGKFSAPSILN